MGVNKYGGLIWTNHALERLTQRGLPQDLAWQAYRYPDDIQKNATHNSATYIKQHYAHRITLIVKENERKELIVISAWMDPPMIGTEDHRKKERYKQYKKASFLGKMWHAVLSQLGM